MSDYQPLEIDESAVGAICSCMRCKADRYESISKLNHHRAKVIARLRKALETVATARMPGEARKIAIEALRPHVPTPGERQ